MTGKHCSTALLPIALVLAGCGTREVSCDCTEWPFTAACDPQCGVTSAVVQSVQKDSVTLKLTPAGKAPEFKTVPLATLKLKTLPKPGEEVRLTYQKSKNEPLLVRPEAIRSLAPAKAPR